ncbi:hypothetical protein ACFQ3S_03055 [Mucilaginibacter terrae]|uniref:hypothetical protein n=1 Tax=Mucilaginibacter terrae TaxID=1955052 RepID=UPI003645A345
MELSLFHYAEMLAFMASIICYKSIIKKPYWVLLPYMLMIVAAEIIGKQLADKQLYKDNVHLFNITTVIEFVVFFFLFYKNVNGSYRKEITKFAIPVYMVAAVINQLFIQGFDKFHTNTMLLGTVLIIIFVFFYFYEAFSKMEPVNLLKEPMFWIATGLFLFYLGDFTINLMHPYFVKNHLQKRWTHIFRIINHNLIIFEYLCISIAIIVCSKNRSALKLQS